MKQRNGFRLFLEDRYKFNRITIPLFDASTDPHAFKLFLANSPVRIIICYL